MPSQKGELAAPDWLDILTLNFSQDAITIKGLLENYETKIRDEFEAEYEAIPRKRPIRCMLNAFSEGHVGD